MFAFGFAKSKRDNLDPDELEDLKDTAALLLAYDGAELDEAVLNDELWELMCDE